MRFLLGVLVGYSMRGKKKLLITVIATSAFVVFIILPAITLLALRLDVQHERRSRPAQTRAPSLKGLSYKNAETKLHTSNLNIRLLAPRSDLSLQPGLIIDQTPQPGEEVDYGYPVGVTLKRIPMALVRNGKSQFNPIRHEHTWRSISRVTNLPNSFVTRMYECPICIAPRK
jgi:hypothetical protein